MGLARDVLQGILANALQGTNLPSGGLSFGKPLSSGYWNVAADKWSRIRRVSKEYAMARELSMSVHLQVRRA